VRTTEKSEHGEDGGGYACLLVRGTAGPCTGHGGRPVDTSGGPSNPFRPTSGMPGLTLAGEYVTALQFDEEQELRGLVCVCDELQAYCEDAASSLAAFYLK